MPTVMIGHTTKKINSTSQSFNSLATLQCKYKEPCSMHDPVLQVQGLPSKVTLYNYCKIHTNNDGTRYYWIDDIVYLTNNIQEIHCRLDPMATYKTFIGQTQALCSYADWTHWNEMMDDLRFSPEVEANHQKIEKNYLFSNASWGSDYLHLTANSADWAVVMQYMSQKPVATNLTPSGGTWPTGLQTIVMPVNAFGSVIGDLYGQLSDNVDDQSTQATWTDYDFMQGMAKLLGGITGYGSWKDNIISCRALPLKISDYSGIGVSETAISVGGVPVDVSGLGVRRITFCILKNGGFTMNLPWNEATDPLQNGLLFLSNSRFASFQLYALGQSLMLDASQLVNQNMITIAWAIDIVHGNWNIRVCEGTAGYESGVTKDKTLTLGNMAGTIGIDLLQLIGTGVGAEEAGYNMTKTLLSAAAVVGAGLVSGGAGALSAAQVGNIAGQFLPSGINATPVPAGNVNLDATSMLLVENNANEIVLVGKQWKPKNISNYGHGDPGLGMTGYCDKYGYPCNDYLTINQCTGYVQCVKASVNGGAGMTFEDRTLINGFLNNGFYFE